MKEISSYTFQIRNNEIDLHGKATLPAVVSCLQEAAWHSAVEMGASVYLLLERGISWVIHRMRIECSRMPDHLETIRVQSWPSGKDRFFFYRDYEAFDQKGNSLIRATSAWIVFDMKTRRMTPVPEWLQALDPGFDRSALPKWKEKLRIPEGSTYQVPIQTRWHDFDLNQHVNNIRYFQWTIESLPHDFLVGHQLKGIDVLLKAEAGPKENLISHAAEQDSNTFLHKIQNEAGKDLVHARTFWGPYGDVAG